MQNFNKFEAILLHSNIAQVLFVDGADAVLLREDAVSREDAQYNIRFTMYVFAKAGPAKKHFISQTVVCRLLLAGCRTTYL